MPSYQEPNKSSGGTGQHTLRLVALIFSISVLLSLQHRLTSTPLCNMPSLHIRPLATPFLLHHSTTSLNGLFCVMDTSVWQYFAPASTSQYILFLVLTASICRYLRFYSTIAYHRHINTIHKLPSTSDSYCTSAHLR